jgi:hypothetical protein
VKQLESDSSLSGVSLLGNRASFHALRAHQSLGKLSNLRKSLAFDSISVKSLGELWESPFGDLNAAILELFFDHSF